MLGTLMWPAPVAAAHSDDRTTVMLEPYVGRLVTVSATLGQERLTLLFDTGGGQTLITPRVANRIGCTPQGRVIGVRMTGERVEFQQCDTAGLQIGGHRVGKPQVAVWDVMTVLPKEVPPLDGVLALDSFADQPFTLDLAAKTLTLESARSLEARVATLKRVQARIATGLSGGDLTVFVRGGLEKPGWFLFDSANLDVTLVAPHMLEGTVAPPSTLDSTLLSLDGLPTQNVPVRVREIIYDGVLAEAVLRQRIWTFRLAGGELWVAPGP